MTKTELVKSVVDQNPSLKIGEVENVVSDTIEQMKRGIKEDGVLELRGFGTFKTKRVKPRLGRNPLTGESVQVPEKMRVRFKPGKFLKQEINA